MKQIKVLSVFGTRPEAIKMAPVIRALEASNKHRSIVCVTGQHREMLDQMIALFEIKVDHDLNIMKANQTLSHIVSQTMEKLQAVIEQEQPDWLLVQGDTSTCFAAALVGFYNKIKVGHVEAGLRTYNLDSPYPEEANRQLVSRIATLHFAPTEMAKNNLLHEHIDTNQIFVTGNTVIDSLLWMKDRVSWKPTEETALASLESVLKNEEKFVLITGHRRENHGQGFTNICNAIKRLAEKFPDWHFIYPVHLNPNVNQPVHEALSKISNIHLIEPLNYEPFIYLLKHCKIILTDSGGIQEEAPSLNKPVLVMRDTTERPEGVASGTAKLVGVDSDEIVKSLSQLIENTSEYQKMADAINPYGDGMASEKIVAGLY